MQSSIPSMPPAIAPEAGTSLESHWWIWALRGLAAIVFGILAFAWPGATISSLTLVFGVYAVMDGVLALFEAVKRRKTDSRWWALLLEGFVSIVLGAAALIVPGLAAITFVYMLGFWAVVTGVFEIVQAIRIRAEIEGEGWLIFGGVLSVAFGLTLIVWPVNGAVTLVWLLGGYAIGFGIVMLVMAFRLRTMSRVTRGLAS